MRVTSFTKFDVMGSIFLDFWFFRSLGLFDSTDSGFQGILGGFARRDPLVYLYFRLFIIKKKFFLFIIIYFKKRS